MLAFLLGQIVRDRRRYLTLKNNGEAPAQVSIKVSDLESRVSSSSWSCRVRSAADRSTVSQAKELEIFDIGAFLKSQLFKNNGYTHRDGSVLKNFSDEF